MLPKVYKIMFWFSISLVVLSFIAVAVFGLRLGVDFKGGSILDLNFQHRPAITDVQQALAGKYPDLGITPEASSGLLIRSDFLTEEQHQQLLSSIRSSFPNAGMSENQFSSVGPVIGSQLEHNSIIAIFVVLFAVIIYIAFVFRKLGRTTSPWAMGLAAIVALIHDITIPFGVFAVLGHYFGIEISGVFVAAALTILGFSVSDTVVIFDRVRENILRHGAKEGFGQVVHKSVLQTLTRSLNTVFTVLLSLFAIYFFGGESIKYFALALIIGIFLGAYSSIFVASPLLVWWTGKKGQQR